MTSLGRLIEDVMAAAKVAAEIAGRESPSEPPAPPSRREPPARTVVVTVETTGEEIPWQPRR